jgi:hypothetical protein
VHSSASTDPENKGDKSVLKLCLNSPWFLLAQGVEFGLYINRAHIYLDPLKFRLVIGSTMIFVGASSRIQIMYQQSI